MLRSRSAFLWRLWASVLGVLVLFASGCAETQLAIHSVKEMARLPNAVEGSEKSKTEKIVPSDGTLGEYKVGVPYEIKGIWYYPKANPSYDEVGIASWYGLKFHGKATANGAIYDMNALTAAHKTLPMPSKVRVTNLSNGRSLIVDINDRGPFVNGRIIDLSRRASQLLGFEEKGLAMVRVQRVSVDGALYVVEKFDTPLEEQGLVKAAPAVQVAVSELTMPEGAISSPVQTEELLVRHTSTSVTTNDGETLPAKLSEFFVQVGAFLQEDNASTLSGRLSLYGPVRVIAINLEGNIYYRVRLGPVFEVDEADALLQRLIAAGYNEAHLVLD